MSATSIVRQPGEGETRWFLGGGVHTWKLSAEETGGAFLLFEDRLARGKTTPLHSHPGEDEVVYVLEGEIMVRVGNENRRVPQGGAVVTLRGVPHAFVVTSDFARLLFLQTPGTGEAFYRNASQPLADPDDLSGPVDFARLRATAQETGSTAILGPSPFGR